MNYRKENKMAKYVAKQEKKYESKYPSEYGSHKSMIDDQYVDFNARDHEYVVCKDNHGSYVTIKRLLDSGLCDYNRSVNIDLRENILQECLKGNFKNVR